MAIPLHILVVDDEPDIVAWLGAVLGNLGHRVEGATNGIEALNFISGASRANDRYQLVLLDVHMPLLDGLGVVRELRRAKDYVDVALFTGNHALLPQLDVEAQRHGCLMVMPKPLDPAQLAQLVEFVGLRQGRAVGGQPRGQTARVERSEPARGYDPFRDPALEAMPPPAETSEYSATDQAHPQSQVAYNAQRTQQFYSAEEMPPPPRPGYPGQRTPLPPPPGGAQRTPLPPAPGQQRPTTGIPQQRPTTGIPQQPPTIQRTPVPQPPAYPQALQPPVTQRRMTDPRAAPQGYDPRQTQGLPPVPAPVAQPPSRDRRLSSGLMPPVPQAPEPVRGIDPRRSSRVGAAPPPAPVPLAQPPQRADPRRTSSLLPPTPPMRATPLEEPEGGGESAHSPRAAPSARAAFDEASNNQSSRVRRTIGGASGAPPPTADSGAPERSRLLACAYCHGSFRAVVKQQPYNLVCVHCGQLNRIDP